MVFPQEREQGLPPLVELPLSVCRKILQLEAQIAPELENPENVLDGAPELEPPHTYRMHPEYTEEKWSLILKKTDDVRVNQLITLMKTSNVPQDMFCQILGTFFRSAPLKNIHSIPRPLTEYTVEEMENGLQHHFDKRQDHDSNVGINSITNILMKI